MIDIILFGIIGTAAAIVTLVYGDSRQLIVQRFIVGCIALFLMFANILLVASAENPREDPAVMLCVIGALAALAAFLRVLGIFRPRAIQER